jgi:hypothetical protein
VLLTIVCIYTCIYIYIMSCAKNYQLCVAILLPVLIFIMMLSILLAVLKLFIVSMNAFVLSGIMRLLCRSIKFIRTYRVLFKFITDFK